MKIEFIKSLLLCCWSLSCIQLFVTPCTVCSLPDSSVHGNFQASILEWVAISFSRGSSWTRDQTWVSCTAGRFFTFWATREAHKEHTQCFSCAGQCLQISVAVSKKVVTQTVTVPMRCYLLLRWWPHTHFSGVWPAVWEGVRWEQGAGSEGGLGDWSCYYKLNVNYM